MKKIYSMWMRLLLSTPLIMTGLLMGYSLTGAKDSLEQYILVLTICLAITGLIIVNLEMSKLKKSSSELEALLEYLKFPQEKEKSGK